MKLAVISDIHGNLEAFEAVLADMDRLDIDETICLGDCIGYGPDPEAVLVRIRERNIFTIMGNHEQAAIDPKRLDWFNPPAKKSLEHSLTMLSQDSLDFIHTFPAVHRQASARFVHGFPPDSTTRYHFQVPPEEMIDIAWQIPEPLSFIGHTHLLHLFILRRDTLRETSLTKGTVVLAPQRRHIVNVGAVGQPRDGNDHAKYVIWDTDANRIEIRFVAYDIGAVVQKILDRGFPKMHANRLWG
jgi:predicted phosphodiesterase